MFSGSKKDSKNFKKNFCKNAIRQLFSLDAIVSKKWKKRPQKLLIISPDPYISQSSPDHSPQPRIDFPFYEISGPDICSLTYLCPALMDTFVVHSDLRILFLASCKYGTYKSCRPGF